ncbi:hypothetical protein ACXM0N_26395 [Peribacillus simplex]
MNFKNVQYIKGELNIKAYLPYLPLIIAFIAASLGYILGQRNSKINRFLQQADINLNEVCGPIFFSLKRIFEVSDEGVREKLLDSFFVQFSTTNSNLYKVGNKSIIDWFINYEKLYYQFKKSREFEDWKKFWEELAYLKGLIEDEYWKNFDSLYGEYRWFQKTLTSNFFVRIWYELIHLLFQATQFSIIVCILFVYFSFWDYFFVGKFPSETILLAVILLFVTVSIYGLLLIVGLNINRLKRQRNSWPRTLGIRFVPKFLNFWDNKVIRSRKNIEIPKMYNQRKNL